MSGTSAETDSLPAWRVVDVPAAASLRSAVFLGRRGGVSIGPFASLNLSCAVGDHAPSVRENWRRVRHAFPQVRHWVRMRQVHGNAVRVVTAQDLDARFECDALVTDCVEVALCVLTADCVPLLLATASAGPVAAVHAGWRGTVAHVATRTLEVLHRRYGVSPADVWVALGPAVGPCCYEVREDVVTALAGAGLERAVVAQVGDRFRVDLRAANRLCLELAGVPPEQMVTVAGCTACSRDDFFSYRRDGARTGRQLSFIALEGPKNLLGRQADRG